MPPLGNNPTETYRSWSESRSPRPRRGQGGISFLVELKGRALALKQQGESADQAGQQITAEFKKKYPDWNIDNLTNFVKAAYTE